MAAVVRVLPLQLLVAAAVSRIKPRRCKQDRQLRKLLALMHRRQAHVAMAVVPEDLWSVPEAEVPLATALPPVVAAE